MTMRIGRVWGIPIELHYSWFPIFGLLSYTLASQQFAMDGPVQVRHWVFACLTSAGFFGCLLAHELAHCAVARRIGIRITGITFFIFGGMARMSAEPGRPIQEFAMAAAGPAMSLCLGMAAIGVAQLLGGSVHDLAGAAAYLAVANLALCVFNLLPAFPMDGGRMLRALLWGVWRDLERATSAASRLTRGLGLMLMLLGAYVAFGKLQHFAWNGVIFILMGGFLIHAAEISYQQVRLRIALDGRRVSGLMGAAPWSLPADLPVADALARWALQDGAQVAPVHAGGRLVGLLDMEEAGALPRAEQPFVPVSRLMRPPRRSDLVRAESRAWDALVKMAVTGHRKLYVIRHGVLMGVLELEQLLAPLRRARAGGPGEPIHGS